VGSKVGDLTLEPIEDSGFGIAEAARPIHDGVEYRLLVRWRSADHAEDFARRRLLLEGFREVAVAHLQLLEQAHILDGDGGLMGEGFEQLDLSVREGADLSPEYPDHPERNPFTEERRDQNRAVPPTALELLANGVFLVGFGRQVVNVDGAAIDDGPARHGVPSDRERLGERNRAGPRPMPCRNTHNVPVDSGHYDVRSLTEPGGILNDRLEHRSEICGRARDDMQDLSRCRLLFQGLGELPVARLQVREEAHVLDRDDGLVGEGLQERDLAVGEWSGNQTGGTDGAYHLPFLQHRGSERTAKAGHSGQSPVGVFRVVEEGRDMGDGLRQDRPASHASSVRPSRKPLPHCLGTCRVEVYKRSDVHQLAIECDDESLISPAQSHRAVGDRIEYRLHLGR